MNACKESQRQAKEFYVGKRPIYHTDEKSYLRRVLRNEGPSLLEEAGIVHFNVLYNPFIYGPSCIASPGPRVRNQVGRRVYSEGSEVLTGMDMFKNAGAGFWLDISRAASTPEILKTFEKHGIAGLGKFCKKPNALAGPE
ncbi:hypothetical protein UCREL1_8948 [Eutypa lata UCREL1]|uniref:Uncharacterized protein n=1 Tax=Eutypa lata (strain UCR-EL1) TaxID=1287681 RepID=M7TBS1_EUTLA|nr:hypothetical protein UCREL1_8948 [Eutypa lata UCREL1]